MQHLLSGPWPARATWVVLPLLVGPALGDALDEHSRAVQLVGAGLAWGVWAGVLVAVLLPRTVSLTALRIAAPAALVAANWAALSGSRGVADLVAVTGAAVAVVAAMSPLTGEVFVDGSGYGDERRLPLRVPTAVLLGPLPLAWLGAVAAPVAGPLLLAAQSWIAGAVVLAAGVPLSLVCVRALHGLARRWLVLVPAGLVVHDQHTLVEPQLFPRGMIARFGPADAAHVDGALDLTAGALGLALELELSEPVAVAPRRRDGDVQVETVTRVLVAPTRPAAALQLAAARRISVG